jgi:hypothetical protein
VRDTTSSTVPLRRERGPEVELLRVDPHDHALGLGLGRGRGAVHVALVHLVEQGLVRVVGDVDVAGDLHVPPGVREHQQAHARIAFHVRVFSRPRIV